MTSRPLRVFLCHSSNDKPAVPQGDDIRELYKKLRAEPWIQPWLDEEELYPVYTVMQTGLDWQGYSARLIKTASNFIIGVGERSALTMVIKGMNQRVGNPNSTEILPS